MFQIHKKYVTFYPQIRMWRSSRSNHSRHSFRSLSYPDLAKQCVKNWQDFIVELRQIFLQLELKLCPTLKLWSRWTTSVWSSHYQTDIITVQLILSSTVILYTYFFIMIFLRYLHSGCESLWNSTGAELQGLTGYVLQVQSVFVFFICVCMYYARVWVRKEYLSLHHACILEIVCVWRY